MHMANKSNYTRCNPQQTVFTVLNEKKEVDVFYVPVVR